LLTIVNSKFSSTETPDVTDTDDDNDGVEDSTDAFPLDATQSVATTTSASTGGSAGGCSCHFVP